MLRRHDRSSRLLGLLLLLLLLMLMLLLLMMMMRFVYLDVIIRR